MDKLCFGCKQTKPVEEFYTRSENGYLYSKCKECHNRRVNGDYKTLPVMEFRSFLQEIVIRCGSQRKAAKRIGVAKTQIRLWLGVSNRIESGKPQRRIAKKSAQRIMDTLYELRRDNVHYLHEHQPGPKPRWLTVNDADAERKRQERAA